MKLWRAPQISPARHHQALAAHEDRHGWLSRAAQEHWSVRQLEQLDTAEYNPIEVVRTIVPCAGIPLRTSTSRVKLSPGPWPSLRVKQSKACHGELLVGQA